MAKAVNKLQNDTPLTLGLGCKLLATTKVLPINIGKGRFLVSCDVNGKHGETEKSNKSYVCNISREVVDYNGDVYDVNFQILKRNTQVVMPKEVAKKSKILSM